MFGGPQKTMLPGNNRREEKELLKDTFQQAKIFKQLHDEGQ